MANGANVIVTVALARLLSSFAYGELNELLGLFIILSMPGSAVLVGVVRRVTSWTRAGDAAAVRRFAARIHVAVAAAAVALAVAAWFARGAVGRELHVVDLGAIAPVFAAGGAWVLLSVDRGLLQAGRAYRVPGPTCSSRAGPAPRSSCPPPPPAWASPAPPSGCCSPSWRRRDTPAGPRTGCGRCPGPMPAPGLASEDVVAAPPAAGPHLGADVATAFATLALLAAMQYADLILLGRADPHHRGAYAAISVASKALVFAAITLAGYLLPEAAIRSGRDAMRCGCWRRPG